MKVQFYRKSFSSKIKGRLRKNRTRYVIFSKKTEKWNCILKLNRLLNTLEAKKEDFN